METLFLSPRESPSSEAYLRKLLSAASGSEDQQLIPHDDGLCSQVYRAKDQDGRRLAVKVVVLEDQVRPHDVKREIRCLTKLGDRIAEDGDDEGQQYIIDLRVAFFGTSDPFATTYYLVLPFGDCTLQHVLEEPSLFSPSSAEELANRAEAALQDDRPAAFVVGYLASLSLHTASPADFLNLFVSDLMRQLLSGLAFMHRRGIAHRDIKPSNLLLNRPSDGTQAPSLRIIDFGTAWESGSRPRPKDAQVADDVEGGQTSEVGTAGFRAPELLFAPAKGYDATKIDLWSAGCVAAAFFTEVEDVPERDTERHEPGWYDDDESFDEGYGDERPEWEREIWGDERKGRRSEAHREGVGEEESIQAASSGVNDEIEASRFGAPATDGGVGESSQASLRAPVAPEPPKAKRRKALFDASRGDLAFAGDIFEVLGLPSNDEGHLWPEAADFRPPLSRMPFIRRSPAPDGIFSRLATLDRTAPSSQGLVELISKALVLSASQRPGAEELCGVMKGAMADGG